MVIVGYRYSVVVIEDGEFYIWGEGDYGRLGTCRGIVYYIFKNFVFFY